MKKRENKFCEFLKIVNLNFRLENIGEGTVNYSSIKYVLGKGIDRDAG